MALEDTFLQVIKSASSKSVTINVVSGVAKNIQADTCDVFRDGLPTLYDVSLTAKDKTTSDFVKITPKENSIVTVALANNVATDGMIIGYSEIEKVEINLANNVVTIDSQGVKMELQTGKFSVKNSVADLKQIITDLITACASITTVTPAGAGSLNPVSVTQFQNIIPKINALFN